MKISGYIDPDKWSVRLNLPYFEQKWFNYQLMNGKIDMVVI